MKAIALTQPWATLVIVGAKRLETRPWRTRHRGRIAIHASLAFPDAARLLCTREPVRAALLRALGHARWADLPCGALLGTVELLDCWPGDDVDLNALPEEERALGDFGPGRWVWELGDPRPLAEPIPFRGRLGLFDVPDDLLPLLGGVTHEPARP
jgi:hypothetical protein